jgi:DNA-directed RNA polymerase specialized sigma24 family protein
MRFEVAYREYRPQVKAYLQRRCRHQIEADDATQETFLQAFRIWDRSAEVENIRRWLIGIAKRVLGHMHRALYIRPEGNAILWDVERDERLVPPVQGLALYVEQLRRHFQGLGPAQCEVMTGLSYGESAREMADRRGATLAATTVAISLGRRRLRERLELNHV